MSSRNDMTKTEDSRRPRSRAALLAIGLGLFLLGGLMRGEAAAADGADELLKPKLYALVIGISDYGNADTNLTYAAKDARDFGAALLNQKGGLYSDVTLQTLSDRNASAAAIREGLDWLIKQVTSRDVGLVYLEGQGVVDEGQRFYFLAADSDPTHLRATAVPGDDLREALGRLAGKSLLFLDTCHAVAAAGHTTRGVVDMNSVVNEFTRSETGVVVFTATTGCSKAVPTNTDWSNSPFTKALIEGLGAPGVKGKADLLGNGRITMSTLDYYLTERVKEITGGTQKPIMIRPATVPDYPIAISK